MRFLCKLLANHNVVLLQETHGTAGYHLSWTPPRGTKAWFSAGANAGCAGVGIVISDALLSQFGPNPLFEEIWPGRAACLRLRGAKGGLDIWSIYCPTGAEVTDNDLFGVLPSAVRSCQTFVGLRDHLRLRVARAMAPALEVMSCVGGDWNYVSESGDRRTLTTMDEAGERDRNEELHFVNRLGKPFGLMYSSRKP